MRGGPGWPIGKVNPRANNRAATWDLTPTEERALKLRREGLSLRQVADALGWKATRQIGSVITAAIDKDRLRILASKAERPKGGNTLAVARGKDHMVSDVRKGKWK